MLRTSTSPAARLRAQVRRLGQRTATAMTGIASPLGTSSARKPPVEVEEVQIEVDVPNNTTSSPLSDVNLRE